LGLTKNRWIFIISLVFLCFATFSAARPFCEAENLKYIDLYLEDAALSPKFRALEINGSHFINLPFIGKYFHIATSWSPTKNELYFKFGAYNFKMYASRTTYYVNGSRRTLKAAPFEKHGELWIPLEFLLRLGLKVKDHSNTKILSLEWQANYILAIENITFQERPGFLIVGAKALDIKHYSLEKPERLVCQLTGAKSHFTVRSVLKSSNPLVKRVRIKTSRPTEPLVIVFDLAQPGSVKIIQDPQEPNRAILVFNYLINDVQLIQTAENAKVRIKSSFPAEYQVTRFPETNQFLIKFFGATYNEAPKVITGDHQKFHSVRITQDDLHTVSVLLELACREEFHLCRSRFDPTLLEIKTPSIIKEVNWSKTKDGANLTISGSDELTETIRMITATKQLQIDLENAQFDPNLIEKNDAGPFSLRTVAPNLAQVELSLPHLFSYNVAVSADRCQINISIKETTLIGKTIVLDPGHGGLDSGACGKQNTREKEINLEVALKLKTLLELAGAEVLLTRNTDTFIGLYERCYFANYHKADLFISIHANSHPDPDIRGIEVFHFFGQTKAERLARRVLNKLVATTGLNSIGVKTSRFVVVRETQMPSILVELGFLSNYQEETILRTADFKANAALGILQGLIDYY
jgi:N-acetylmuramoyl-L-alanine amidase